MREPSPRSRGPLLRLVHGGLTTGAGWRAAATEGGSSRRKHLEKEGTEGNLIVRLVGAGATLFGRATVDRGGGRSFSMGQCLEHGERELGRDWMWWRGGVLLGALYRAGVASRSGGGEESVAAGGV
jgi:hypothetical protein